jgi:hypothetical protein
MNMARLGRIAFLAVLTLIAGWLRFSAIDFGLPEQYRPDEELTVPAALDFENDWNPHLTIYPAAQTYLIHGVLRSYARLIGADGNLRNVYRSDNNAEAYLIGRRITAVMGTATIPVVYLAAAPVFGPGAAMVSAAIVAASFIHVRESKFVKVEVPAVFWLALSILMALRIATKGRWSDYVLAGLFCGLAAATHYTAGAIALGILVAHFEARKRENLPLLWSLIDGRIYLAGVASIAAFLCADPYFIYDWQKVRADFAHALYDRWDSPAGYGWHWLLLRAMPQGFGLGLEIFLLVAMLWVAFRPKQGTWALLAFVIFCFYGLTRGHPQLEFRYLVNPLMALALLGGIFATDLVGLIRSRMGRRTGYSLAIVGALSLTPSLVRDVQLNRLLKKPDTRTIAKYWILDRIPAGSTIALMYGDTYGKPKVPGLYHMISIDSIESLRAAKAAANWVVVDDFPPLTLWSRPVSDAEIAELNTVGTLEFDVGSIMPKSEPPICDPNDAFYAPFTHITSMARPGPRIRIWKLAAP